MKRILFLSLLMLVLFTSCNKDDDQFREDLPGIASSISGNVKDYHRNSDVADYEIKLMKYWSCPGGGIGPNYCKKVVSTTTTDGNGNYQLNFDYNLRSDERYILAFNDVATNRHIYEFVRPNGEFYRDFESETLVAGENNILNLNAFIPIKIRINLTVLNNHTPPLITGIKYNNKSDFGTQLTYENFKTFEIFTRPNAAVEIKFWYFENYTSNNPISHIGPTIPYQTTEAPVTELDFEIDCNEF